jgi:hypothetical protein
MERSATSPSSDATEQRLARLERDNRRLRWVAGAALFGATCALIAGVSRGPTGTTGTIEASRFVVRDELGRERALLGFDHPSAPRHSPLRLGLYNPDDGSSLIVWLSGAFAGVIATSHGTDGAPFRAETFANPQEGTGFRLATGAKRPQAVLRARAGAGQLVLEDPAGRVTFAAPQ